MTTNESADVETLANIIKNVTDPWDDPLDEVRDIPPIVNAIIAAGYSKGGTATPDPAGVSEAVGEIETQVSALELVAKRVREQGDVQQVLMDAEGVSRTFSLSDELWIISYLMRSALPHLSGPAVTDAVAPECLDHLEVQRRDGKRPWCDSCGWNRGQPAIPAAHIARTVARS